VTLCGLATDFCVLYSALDAVAAGFGRDRGARPPAAASIGTARSPARSDAMRAAGVELR